MSENVLRWHPYPKEKPPAFFTCYLITLRYKPNHDFTILNRDAWIKSPDDGYWERFNDHPEFEIVAWAELPEPYTQEAKND